MYFEWKTWVLGWVIHLEFSQKCSQLLLTERTFLSIVVSLLLISSCNCINCTDLLPTSPGTTVVDATKLFLPLFTSTSYWLRVGLRPHSQKFECGKYLLKLQAHELFIVKCKLFMLKPKNCGKSYRSIVSTSAWFNFSKCVFKCHSTRTCTDNNLISTYSQKRALSRY